MIKYILIAMAIILSACSTTQTIQLTPQNQCIILRTENGSVLLICNDGTTYDITITN